MRLLSFIVDQAFLPAEDGKELYAALLSKGGGAYIVPDEATGKMMRRQLGWMVVLSGLYAVLTVLILGLGFAFIPEYLVLLAGFVVMVAYALIYERLLLARLELQRVPLARGQFVRQYIRRRTRRGLCLELIAAIVFSGVFVIQQQNQPGLIFSVLAAAWVGFLAYMLYRKSQEKPGD